MAFPEHGLALVQDGWLNLNTGLGDPTRDKRKSAALSVTRLSLEQSANLYRGDKYAAKVVDIPAGEMVREWFDVLVEKDEPKSEKMEKRLKELGAKSAFKQAIIWAREFGGAGILIGANDGAQDAALPLDLAKVKSVDFLTAVERSELLPAAWYNRPSQAKYGLPMIYRLQPRILAMPALAASKVIQEAERNEKKGIFKSYDGVVTYVHESRILPFYGVKLSRMEMMENLGWGDTVYNRIFALLQDFNTAFDSVAYTLSDFAQGVLKMKGLAQAIASKGSTTITQRLQGINLSKSVARIMLIDSDGEEFKREALSFGSIPDTLDRFCNLLAAAADMPLSLLMGQAPAGLNATGDSDIRWFYDHISEMQEEEVVPQAERLVRILFNEPAVGGEPKNWSIKCRPLWQLDEVQESERRKNIADADAAYVNSGTVTPEEVASTRFGGDEYNPGKIQLVESDAKKRALAAQELAEAEAERLSKQDPGNDAPDDEGGKKPGEE
jgi:phage-related protein (TIGR01555 family)